MSVFNNLYNPQKHFSYQKGKIITTTPWTRPNYSKIREFLIEIKNTSNIMDDYDLYLLGGVLWDFNNTWDVDINMVGEVSSYIILEDYMHYMYDIALNKYNLLVDISWVENKPYNIINNNDYPEYIDSQFLKIGYTRKQIGEEYNEVILHENSNITLCSEYLVSGNYKNHLTKRSLKEKIKNNINPTTRISFPVKDFLEKDEDYFLRNTNRL